MLKIGITGGIGSGKTTVCKIIEHLGIPIYYADDAAKWLMQHDEKLVTALKKTFGNEIYNDQNQLQRQVLAAKVFNNRAELTKLEHLVHPAVYLHGQAWIQKQENTQVPYILKEAALLFESGSYQTLDKIITVFAPEALRIQRVQARDQSSVEAIKARIDKQMPEAKKLKLADFVIHNDGKQLLIPQILTIHRTLLLLNSVQ